MARSKNPTSGNERGGLDYYEYKRIHEMDRLRKRAVEVTGDVERVEERPRAQAPQSTLIFNKLIGGIKRGSEVVHGSSEDTSKEHVIVFDEPAQVEEQPVAAAYVNRRELRQDEPRPDAAHDEVQEAAGGDYPESEPAKGDREAVIAALDEMAQADELDAGANGGEADADDIEIMNPFAGLMSKAVMLGGMLKQMREVQRAQKLARIEEQAARLANEADEPEADDALKPEHAEPKWVASAIGIIDEPDDDDGLLPVMLTARRRHSRYQLLPVAARKVSGGDESDDDDYVADPLGVIQPADDETHEAFMRPQHQSRRDRKLAKALVYIGDDDDGDEYFDTYDDIKEDTEMSEIDRAELTEKLMEELNSVPALSRRERKAMANAGTLSTPSKLAQKPMEEPDAKSVDEPTQQFKPIRARAIKVEAPIQLDEDDEVDGEADYEDTKRQRRGLFGRRSNKKKHYVDEELENEYVDDEYDDDEYDDYNEYDDDDDYGYDDEEYDDYDEAEEYEGGQEMSAGMRLLRFFKGLLVFLIVILLIIVCLRQLEASRIFNLDGVRSLLPISWLFPAPKDAIEPVVVGDLLPEGEPVDDDLTGDGELDEFADDGFDELDEDSELNNESDGALSGDEEDGYDQMDEEEAQIKSVAGDEGEPLEAENQLPQPSAAAANDADASVL